MKMGILACGKGRFLFGSNKEDFANSFILKHARHWQQLQVLTEVVKFYIIRGKNAEISPLALEWQILKLLYGEHRLAGLYILGIVCRWGQGRSL